MKTVLAMLVAAAVATGCVAHPRPAHHPHRHKHIKPRVVVVKAGHRHTRHCGHYHYRHRWYYHHGHVHGRGCGHVYVRGVWVLR